MKVYNPTAAVELKLFYNLSNGVFYAQIGEQLFPVKESIAGALQSANKLDIRHAKDTKDMQIISLKDKQ